jgi:ACS family hexuronate transporter-like MFS transporter
MAPSSTRSETTTGSAQAMSASAAPLAKAAAAVGRYRWTICWLLFVATTINYIDRNVVSILKQDVLIGKLGWTEADYGNVFAWFSLSYAVMMIFAGRFIDRIGLKLGFAIAIIWWSLAAMGHAFSGAVAAFAFWRVMLGIGEAANFPASIKAVSVWFPKRERALATGLFNSGTNIGSILTPVAVAWILTMASWQVVFIALGALGFVWLIFWWAIYDDPEHSPRLSKAELDYIHSEPEPPTPPVAWSSLIGFRQTWAVFIGKGLTDPVWWFYLFWVPGFLSQRFGVKISGLALPILIIYTLASIGSILGGWIAGVFLQRQWTTNAARKTALLLCALAVTPVVFTPITNNYWLAVVLVGIACAGHQGWSANIFTTASDMFPKAAVASVTGIGGFGGAIAGWAMGRWVGGLLNAQSGNYLPIFAVAAAIYLVALLIVHLLVPNLEKAKLRESPAR